MCKKCLFVGGALALLFSLIFGGNYVRLAVSKAKQAVNNAEPIPMKIDRAELMIQELDEDIYDAQYQIAKAEVEVGALSEEVDDAGKSLAKSQKDILTLQADLHSENSYFTYAGKNYTRDDVKVDLARRFERHKVMQDTSDMHRMQLTAKQNALASARKKLKKMQDTKRQLEVDVENLRARLKALEVAKTATDLDLDDSRFSEVKGLVSDISSRIDVAEKMINHRTDYNSISLEQPETEKDITKEVAEYFGQDRPNKAVVNK